MLDSGGMGTDRTAQDHNEDFKEKEMLNLLDKTDNTV